MKHLLCIASLAALLIHSLSYSASRQSMEQAAREKAREAADLPFWNEESPQTSKAKRRDISELAEFVHKYPTSKFAGLSDKELLEIGSDWDAFLKAYKSYTKKPMPHNKITKLSDLINDTRLNLLVSAIIHNASTEEIINLLKKYTVTLNRPVDFKTDAAFAKASEGTPYRHRAGETIAISPIAIALVLRKGNAIRAFLQNDPHALNDSLDFLIDQHMKPEQFAEIISWLLDHGLDENLNFFDGPLLVRFAKNNLPAVVRVLLHAGANPNLRGPASEGTTPQAPSFLEELTTFSREVQQEWTQFLAYKKERKAKIREALEPHRQQLPTTAAVPQEEVPGAGAAQTIPKEIVEIISEY